mmetsp:Transcript_7921/g.15418  ORF Transcript_7921/g.15418 Transcript_7921/m.15418 type:complete len:211 (+) Transcript_7921:770-1402(+)
MPETVRVPVAVRTSQSAVSNSSVAVRSSGYALDSAGRFTCSTAPQPPASRAMTCPFSPISTVVAGDNSLPMAILALKSFVARSSTSASQPVRLKIATKDWVGLVPGGTLPRFIGRLTESTSMLWPLHGRGPLIGPLMSPEILSRILSQTSATALSQGHFFAFLPFLPTSAILLKSKASALKRSPSFKSAKRSLSNAPCASGTQAAATTKA